MTYSETITYLYNSVPVFQNIGKDAYKEGLSNTHTLDAHFGHPHASYQTIHVAGTNGKGSCAHTLAAILQASGLRVGLYTSPHLKDFRERIRVNGGPIPESYVVNFVAQEKDFFEPLHPSFFELTTALAFKYFKEEQIDIAVIEVGLGGRLDCTNIISPILSVITNISFDHMQFLGDTLGKIAFEKAGIMKPDVPVVVGETVPETKEVFLQHAQAVHAPLVLAEDQQQIVSARPDYLTGSIDYDTLCVGKLHGELGGLCQEKNTNTILNAILQLQKLGMAITSEHVHEGFAHVCELTGLMGRWQIVHRQPMVVCDTGHNIGGFSYIVKQLEAQHCQQLRVVMGMVSDKDIHAVLQILPKKAQYYFTKAAIPRALNEEVLQQLAQEFHLSGNHFATVREAFAQALRDSSEKDFIYVGGSSYIVADFLSFLRKESFD